jgi:hypothetical protein
VIGLIRRVRRARRPRAGNDDGVMLPLVMGMTVVSAMVVISLAGYVTADLRYGYVVEQRADRLAAADGGLRFGIERLRNFQTLCTTKAGTGGGFTTVFPPEINGATSNVTCRRIGNAISDVQGWGVVVTGAGVPAGQALFSTKGAGGSSDNVKTFSGPIYVADPERIDLAAKLEIENGDLWYTSSDCDTPTPIPEMDTGYLVFSPDFFRGPLCTDLGWNTGLFSPPTAGTPTIGPVNPPVDDSNPSCRVFSPGKYTTALPLASSNYFRAGEYYFENVNIELQNQTLIGGFPAGAGDNQKIDNADCLSSQQLDRATTTAAGGRGGATFYLGGSSKLDVRNGGELEIFRRRQNETYLSIYALQTSGTGYIASTLDHNDWLLETKSGSNNDVAIHGLVWAPYTGATLGNITNAANGQLLGGIVVAVLDTQASASASAFAIGIETNPVDVKLLLISTATKNGISTSIRAVVQYRPDSGELAVNSWRVSN